MIELLVLQLTALAATVALAVDGYLLLHLTVGERWKFVAFLNDVSLLLLLANLGTVPIVWLLDAPWLWKLYALPGLVALLVWYGRLFVPKHTPSCSPGSRVTVATHNIAVIDDDFDHRLAVIRAIDADLIGLQESRGWQLTGPDFPEHHVAGVYGFTLLSRHPIVPQSGLLLGVAPGRTMPVGIRVVVNINDTLVSVYVIHPKRPQINIRPLIYNRDERQAGVNDLIWQIQQETNPVIMLGDCNMGYRSNDYRHLRRVLVDAWRRRGFGLGLTAPTGEADSPIRLLRSDMIWHSHDIKTHSIEVWPQSGKSDHYPVVATLCLPVSSAIEAEALPSNNNVLSSGDAPDEI